MKNKDNRGHYFRTQKHKEHMKNILKGRTFSPKHIRNMSIAQIKRKERDGYLQSPEYRKRRSQMMKNNKLASQRLDLKEKFKEIKILYKSGKSALQIGKIFDADHNTILSLLRKANIQTRPQKFYVSGDKNYNWIYGNSEYNQDFNESFKKFIRVRDKCCMLCNRPFIDENNRNLSVHHINYDKKLSIKENCVSLCVKCHILTNINRQHWTKFFQSLLLERYNYKYEDNKIIIKIGGKNG